MKLIAGLGNPGKKYEKTRHNIGWRVLDELAENFKFEKKFNAEISESGTGKAKTIYAKPQTFMNNSGEAVLAVAEFYKIKPKDITVIHDDLDLPFGNIRESFESGSAGHNGVQSIIDSLGTKGFCRIRIGIGPRPEKIPADKFVLQKFSLSEEKEMKKIISEAAEKIK